MDHKNVTTALELPNVKIVKNLGLVKGIVVRSRSIVGSIGGSLQTLVGGNISLFTTLCERTRADAYELMVKHADELGANAIISVRYDATGGGSAAVGCSGGEPAVAAGHSHSALAGRIECAISGAPGPAVHRWLARPLGHLHQLFA